MGGLVDCFSQVSAPCFGSDKHAIGLRTSEEQTCPVQFWIPFGEFDPGVTVDILRYDQLDMSYFLETKHEQIRTFSEN